MPVTFLGEVADVLAAAAHGIRQDDPADRFVLRPCHLRNALRRMEHMAAALSRLYTIAWDARAPAVAVRPLLSWGDRGEGAQEVRALLADGVRNRMDLPTLASAQVRLGAELVAALRAMAEHMERLRLGYPEAVEAGDGGFDSWSAFYMAVQLQQVGARRMAEELLWWMTRPGVLESVTSSSAGPDAEWDAPEEALDAERYPERARAFRLVVPQLHRRMREMGLAHAGVAAVRAVRAGLQRLRDELLLEGRRTPRAAVVPSVDTMMEAIERVEYSRGAGAGKDAAAPLLKEGPRRVVVRVRESLLLGGEPPDRRYTSVGARELDRTFAETALLADGALLADAYDERGDDYVLEGLGSKRIARAVVKHVARLLVAGPSP